MKCPNCVHTGGNSTYFVKAAAVRTKDKKKSVIWNAALIREGKILTCYMTHFDSAMMPEWILLLPHVNTQLFSVNYNTRCLKMCKTDFIYIEGTESDDVTRSVWEHMFLTVSQFLSCSSSPTPTVAPWRRHNISLATKHTKRHIFLTFPPSQVQHINTLSRYKNITDSRLDGSILNCYRLLKQQKANKHLEDTTCWFKRCHPASLTA